MNSHSTDHSRSQRKRMEAKAKVSGVVAAASSTQARVTDPDAPNIDRTPLPLSKPPQPLKSLGKRAAERRPSAQTDSTSRKATDSVSQANSTNSSDRVSGSTPDDSTTLGFEEGSETRSTERSTFKQSEMVSQVSAQRTDRPEEGDHSENAADQLPALKVEQWEQRDKDAWLSAQVNIVLSTMPVVMHFSQEDELVTKETADAQVVAAANATYSKYCEKRAKDEGNSRYNGRGTTTLNNPKRSVQTLAKPPASRSTGSHVTPWKLSDEYKRLNAEDDLDEGQVVEVEAEEVGDGDGDDGDMREGGENEEVDVDEAAAGGSAAKPKARGWLAAESLLETVLVMERAVLQNTFEELQLAYRGIEMPVLSDHLYQENTIVATDPRDRKRAANAKYGGNDFLDTQGEKKEEERRQREERQRAAEAAVEEAQSRPAALRGQVRELWKFSSSQLEGKHVTCMAWNRVNTDLMAVGYGNDDATDDKHGGTICCWSLKNPVAPERIIRLESDAGVTSLSFSESHPSLLAVGTTDGTLLLYDVRVHGNTPALKSAVNAGQHTGTIWDVRWIQKGRDRGEGLMTVSADGHVMEWGIKKGLERSADLMKLKRVPNQGSENTTAILGGGRNNVPREALLSRQSGGMTFDVSPRDSIIYVVGTEDGTLHKCSKSQNENYILDYRPHEEPVYRLRWNPFNPHYFLTCSADWTSRLYHVNKPEPVLRLDANEQDAVHDISWSTTRCTVFATGTAQGKVHIWDIADPLRAKASYEIKGQSISSVMFAPQESSVVVVGDSKGDVTVLKLIGPEFERNGLTDEEQEKLFGEIVSKVSM